MRLGMIPRAFIVRENKPHRKDGVYVGRNQRKAK